MGPWYLHLPKSTFWDLFTCNDTSWLLKAVKHGAFFSHLNGHWTSARPLPWRSTKFVAFKSLLITLKLSSSHSYQPLVLISTAQCITRLRSKRVFAKHSKSRDHHRYIDQHHTCGALIPPLTKRDIQARENTLEGCVWVEELNFWSRIVKMWNSRS